MTKFALPLFVLYVASLQSSASAFNADVSMIKNQNQMRKSMTSLAEHKNDDLSISRRAAFVKSAAAIAGGMNIVSGLPIPAFAEITEETAKVTTRMGGLLVSS